jgi:hypothetical protein
MLGVSCWKIVCEHHVANDLLEKSLLVGQASRKICFVTGTIFDCDGGWKFEDTYLVITSDPCNRHCKPGLEGWSGYKMMVPDSCSSHRQKKKEKHRSLPSALSSSCSLKKRPLQNPLQIFIHSASWSVFSCHIKNPRKSPPHFNFCESAIAQPSMPYIFPRIKDQIKDQ